MLYSQLVYPYITASSYCMQMKGTALYLIAELFCLLCLVDAVVNEAVEYKRLGSCNVLKSIDI